MNKSIIWRGIFIMLMGAILLLGTLMGILLQFYFAIRGLYGAAVFALGAAIIAIGYFIKGKRTREASTLT